MNQESMRDVRAGLYSLLGGRVPLRGVEVRAEVIGGFSRALVRQRYENVERSPVEAVYTFPLPADATLTGFSMTCNGRRMDGEVREREEAFRAYDDAISAGHGGALLDQERPNVFTASVGNLLPGEETIVEIEYVQRVQADEGAIRWVVPSLVAPRYVPGTSSGDRTAHGAAEPTARVPDADRISPPIGADIAYGLKLDLVFDLGVRVEVESPSHAIVATYEAGRTRVTFAQREVALDRDVVVTAHGVGEGQLATVATHRQPGNPGVFALTVIPDLFTSEKQTEPEDVVFLVDRSGSMGGDSIREAKAALRLCLRHLREGDRFTILAFDDHVLAFSPELLRFTQKTLTEADRWVESLEVAGGTELLAPLREAVRLANDGIVVLMTDGQVGNEDEILRQTLHHRGRSRIYSFGIGTNVSDTLLRDLAKKTGGAVELIHPGERIDEKVVAQFARATAARVTDLSVRFSKVDAGELAPADVPALVDGEPWVLFGTYESEGSGSVEIKGTRRGAPFVLRVPVDLPATASCPALPKLWATERIRDLEVAHLTGRRADAMKDRIVKLATTYGVASRYTSFVVIEKRTGDRRAAGQPETRVVPVNVPAGWAMFQKPEADALMSMVTRCGAMPAGAPMASMGAPPPPRAMAASFASRAMDLSAPSLGRSSPKASRPAPLQESLAKGEGGADPVLTLLQRQSASGLWDDDGKDVAATIRATARALLELCRGGITTAHAVHGSQVRKAVVELVARVQELTDPKNRPLVELALAVAWLVASGRRTRGIVEAIVAQNPGLGALRGKLHDDAAVRQHAEALAPVA